MQDSISELFPNSETYPKDSMSKYLAFRKPKKILIVDDELDIRLTLAEMLVNEGYKVATARNGADGLSYLREQDELPDLIILDINMPVQDGLEFRYHQSREPELSEIPIVMMSGDIERRNGAPDDPFISKPFELPDIIYAIEKASH